MRIHEIEVIDPITDEIILIERLPSSEVSARLREIERAGYDWSDGFSFTVVVGAA